ncbi:MurR/RpiR family transcriptional regulator [Lacticaseibacillus hegangensis]|uniref:MurR/RpiR family transcriptional regulator n=1 Tax=Lacticaseibacillus hegangensis TaxID=2486010 RepID=A0ABW4CXM6_9LACO|nr:MurR/RpiR family transcriptional regulator [Lacticaseibacillus hegangensis]
MNIIQQVASIGSRLTPAEHRVASYIIDYPELVLKQNVGQLAQASGSSPASVVRFFKRANFGNLAQFKINLSSELAKQSGQRSRDVDPHDDYEIVKQKLLDNSIQSLYQTGDTLAKGIVLDVVEQIHNAKRIYLLGIGASYLVAENIVQKWMRAGVTMQMYQELNVFLPLVETAGPNDLFWFISNSGKTPEIVWAASAVKKRGLKSVSLTKVGDNELSRVTRWQLHTASPLETEVRSAATNSLLSQFLVIDIVYYFYLSQYYDEIADNINRTHGIIAEYHQALADNTKTTRTETNGSNHN